jgi:hypothetical protein
MSVADVDRFCPGCGYDLRGITSDRCPECGTPFDPNQPTEPQIPWSHRATLGRRRAFWRTVKLATFRTSQFAAEINRPVSFADARSFRRAVVWHAWVPLALTTVVIWIVGYELYKRPWYPNDVLGSIAMWGGIPVALASLWLFLYLLFGAHSYFYHPKRLNVRQQNRAVALSYYACAPWAYVFAPVLAGFAIAGLAAMGELDHPTSWLFNALVILAAGVVALVWLALFYMAPQRMLHRTTHAGAGWIALFGLVLRPAMFVLLLGLTIGLINLAYWGGMLMLISLQ